MFWWALTFFFLAFVAGILSFASVAAIMTTLAQGLLIFFLSLFLMFLWIGLRGDPKTDRR